MSEQSEAAGVALRHAFVAATLTPADRRGRVDLDALGPYVSSLVRDGADALAVGVHTGRGDALVDGVLGDVIGSARDAVTVPIIAGVGAGPDGPDAGLRGMTRRAAVVAGRGADAILVHPFPGDPDEIVLRHKRLAAETGLPVLAFVLYRDAWGGEYDVDLVRRLVTIPEVAGVKIAVLHDAVRYQDLVAAVRAERPEALVLTGEDRMFAASFMWGADGCLVGLGAARANWVTEVVRAWHEGRYDDFVAAGRRLDALAALAFAAPFDDYVQRMAWLAADEGRLPAAASYDLRGGGGGAREEFLAAVRRIDHGHGGAALA